MSTFTSLRAPVALLAVALTGPLAGCGDEADVSRAPTVGEIRITCQEPPANRQVTDDVIAEVAVEVSGDDVTEVKATLNGMIIPLAEDEEGRWYVWSPPATYDSILCEGTFHVIVEAVDASGRRTRVAETVENEIR